MTQSKRRALGMVLLISALAVGPVIDVSSATAASISDRVPLVDWNCLSAGRVSPTSIVLACGDGNAVAEQLVWKRWTTKGASGVGLLRQNNCVPDCAAGTFHFYPATFQLSETVTADKRPYFTRVRIAFTGASPVRKKVEVVKDCFDTPPAPYIPRCPADLQAAG